MSDLVDRRQEAIDNLLRLMGCADSKQAHCEHLGAIAALAQTAGETTFKALDEGLGGWLSEAGIRVACIEIFKSLVYGEVPECVCRAEGAAIGFEQAAEEHALHVEAMAEAAVKP